LAEEVMRAETPETERFLLLASVPNSINVRVARSVLGVDEPEEILERLTLDGLLHAGEGQFRFHPLLRSFLRRKLELGEPELYRALVKDAIEEAWRDARWEEAFELSVEASDLNSALLVLEAATPEMLAAGRVELLERWLSECGSLSGSHPAAVLARSEILIRKGQFREASALAEDLTATLASDHQLASRAFQAAGQARYLRSENEPAARFQAKASELAQTPEDRANALWGTFLAQLDLDVHAASAYLDELSTNADDLNTRLRVATGRLTLASHEGSFKGIWPTISPLFPLVKHATDPLVRSNLLAQAAYLAIARADYDVAVDLATQALRESIDLRHGFATGSCLAYRIAAQVGRRKLDSARRDLADLAHLHAREEDPYLQTEFVLMQVRLALAEGDLVRAWKHANEFPSVAPDGATHGEHLGIAAIVLAALGEVAAARSFIGRAREITSAVEARIYTRFAEVLLGDGSTSLTDALQEASDADFLEAFVIAYRASPAILRRLDQQPHDLMVARPIMARANDQRLAKRMGLPPEDTPTAVSLLTPRELEVLGLLGEGLSNADIAKRLFVSQSTAKVHVHHILAKLGVKTRLQAALVAERLRT
jgi:ATP/maltotriose-dependent transcriptional regulator MalT